MLMPLVDSYLAMRRAMGFRLVSEGERLRSFAQFSDARGASSIQSNIAIEWAAQARSRHERARRLGDVICFSRYWHAEDERHQVPPCAFGTENAPRIVPYIFSSAEVRRLLQAIRKIPRLNAFQRLTCRTLLALLACTGLRLCEALALQVEDVTVVQILR